MDSQTTVNGRSSEAPPKAFARSLGQFGSEAVSLMELQLQLAWEDLRAVSRQAGLGIAAMIFGAGCALGGLPVLVFGIAEILIRFLDWPRWATLFGLGILTVCVSAGLIYFGARKAFRTLSTFERSKAELVRNMEWLRSLGNGVSRH
jgi:hypothetical protein